MIKNKVQQKTYNRKYKKSTFYDYGLKLKLKLTEFLIKTSC